MKPTVCKFLICFSLLLCGIDAHAAASVPQGAALTLGR